MPLCLNLVVNLNDKIGYNYFKMSVSFVLKHESN